MTKPIRPRSLARLLESCDAAVWLIDDQGRLAHLSPAMVRRLGEEANSLLGLTCPISLRPAAGLSLRGYQTRNLELAPESMATAHFLRIASTTSSGSWVLGALGTFTDDSQLPLSEWFGPGGLRESAAIAAILDDQSHRNGRRATRWTLGQSAAASLLRQRIELAERVRTDIGLFVTSGSDAVAIAWQIHDTSAPHEPALLLDGSLMDVELLSVYAAPIVSAAAKGQPATLIIERLAEMPGEGQAQLLSWLEQFDRRLRLIGVVDQVLLRPDESPAAELARLTGTPLPPRGLAESLHTRLATFAIITPPLADRREDIPLLASSILSDLLIDPPRLSRDATDALMIYPWPGNAEELRSAMQFAVRATIGPRIGREHLPLAIRSYRPGQVAKKDRKGTEDDFRIDSLDQEVAKFTQEMIDRAMKAAGGNKADAARRLGISRTRLLRKLEELSNAPENES